MSKAQPTFYVFHGEDDYTIHEQVKKMREKMGDDLNITEFDNPKTPVADILSAAKAMPFLSDRRMVIVHGMLATIGKRGAGQNAKEELKRLVAELPDLPDTARLIFVEQTTLSKSHAVVKLIGEEPTGFIKAFDAPKNPARWIENRAKTLGVTIDSRAVRALVMVIEQNLRRAENELDKLSAYVGEGGTILEEHVALLTPYVPETNIFDMVDAIGQRNGKQAMQLLHQKLDVDEVDPFQIFGMVVRQFRLLLQAREIVDNGGNQGTIAEMLKIHSYPAKKLAQQVKGFNIKQLERIYENLLDIDIGVKTGKIDMVTGLDLFVAGVTGGA